MHFPFLRPLELCFSFLEGPLELCCPAMLFHFAYLCILRCIIHVELFPNKKLDLSYQMTRKLRGVNWLLGLLD